MLWSHGERTSYLLIYGAPSTDHSLLSQGLPPCLWHLYRRPYSELPDAARMLWCWGLLCCLSTSSPCRRLCEGLYDPEKELTRQAKKILAAWASAVSHALHGYIARCGVMSFPCSAASQASVQGCNKRTREHYKLAEVWVQFAHVVEVQYIVRSMHKPIVELLPTELGLTVSLRKVLQVRQAPSEEYGSCVGWTSSVMAMRNFHSSYLLLSRLTVLHMWLLALPGSPVRSREPGRLSLIACCTRRTSALSQEPSLTSGCLGITSSDCAALVAAAMSLEAVL